MRLTPRDILTLEVIQRHWWLPSNYLYAFTKHLGRNPFFYRRRLLQLVDAGFLVKPIDINDPRVKNDFLNYALTDRGRDALEFLGTKHQYAVDPSGGYKHEALTVAVTANIELQAKRAGCRYISQEEILRRAPEATRRLSKPLSLGTEISYTFPNGGTQRSDRPTVPDQLFGIEYPDQTCRFFAVEADRGTESIEPTNLKDNSILRKLLSYRDTLIKGTYKKVWDIPNLLVLFVTIREPRLNSMIELARKVSPKVSRNLLFKYAPGFGLNFTSPKHLPELWNQPWSRAGETPLDISKP